jgi:hypothetical protein
MTVILVKSLYSLCVKILENCTCLRCNYVFVYKHLFFIDPDGIPFLYCACCMACGGCHTIHNVILHEKSYARLL